MRFSPRADDTTIFQKIASPSQAKIRPCSCGFSSSVLMQLVNPIQTEGGRGRTTVPTLTLDVSMFFNKQAKATKLCDFS